MESFYIQKRLLFNKLLLVKNKMYFYSYTNTIELWTRTQLPDLSMVLRMLFN